MSSQPSPYLLTLGDMGITEAWIVTPYGSAPLRGSEWTVREWTYVGQRTPTYAIVLAVVFALFCLLGLLFLLIKEQTIQGYVEVGVRSGGWQHVTQLRVWQPEQVMQLNGLVQQARALSARAPMI